MTPDIITIGEPLVEFSAAKEGSLTENTHYIRGFGGDTSNFAVAAARAGAAVAYVTMVGNDPFGNALMALWKTEGINTAWVGRSDRHQTGIYFISRDRGRHDFTYFRTGSAASRMTPEILPREAIARARVLHFSGISQAISPDARETCAEAVRIAREAGVLISYDPNLRTSLWPLEQARQVIDDTVAQVDFLMPSFEDARTLTGLNLPEKIIAHYLARGAKTIVLKCGDQGAVLAQGGSIRHFAALPMTPVDASGAGDAFCGAFMAEVVRGSGLDDCVRFAGAAAALSVRGLGCVTPIPGRREILEALAGRMH